MSLSMASSARPNAAHFQLMTRWHFAAPLERVWDVISMTERWPTWWPAVIAVRTLESGNEDGVGAYRQMTWRTALPYRLSFNMRTVSVIKHAFIEGQSDGNLAGRGCWQFAGDGNETHVQYDWEVAVTKPWMRSMAPILRRVFAWNHAVVMEWGRQGLSKVLRLD